MSELHNDIIARLKDPSSFLGSDYDASRPYSEVAADAITQLFETASPIKTDQPPLDLPAELLDMARNLRGFAEAALTVQEQKKADRLGYLANLAQDVAALITQPARILQILIRDRDRWQQAHKEQSETLALTETALGQTQDANVTLAQGQSTLIGLLERVARFMGAETITHGTAVDEFMSLEKAIHAILNQVTAIEENASGRLVATTTPEPVDPNPQDTTTYEHGKAD